MRGDASLTKKRIKKLVLISQKTQRKPVNKKIRKLIPTFHLTNFPPFQLKNPEACQPEPDEGLLPNYHITTLPHYHISTLAHYLISTLTHYQINHSFTKTPFTALSAVKTLKKYFPACSLLTSIFPLVTSLKSTFLPLMSLISNS